jgi:DNA-binding transcriptional regulator YiaG
MERFSYPHGTLTNVFLSNGFERKSGTYGETVRYENLAGLSDAILEAIILKPSRLSGEEITYLRDTLDLFQSELADFLGVDEQTVSLWEREKHNIPKSCDNVIRKYVTEKSRKRLSTAAFRTALEEFSRLASQIASYDLVCALEAGEWRTTHMLCQSVYRAPREAWQDISVPAFERSEFSISNQIENSTELFWQLNISQQWPAHQEKISEVFATIAAAHSALNQSSLNISASHAFDDITFTLRGSTSSILVESNIPAVDKQYAQTMTRLMGKNYDITC